MYWQYCKENTSKVHCKQCWLYIYIDVSYFKVWKQVCFSRCKHMEILCKICKVLFKISVFNKSLHSGPLVLSTFASLHVWTWKFSRKIPASEETPSFLQNFELPNKLKVLFIYICNCFTETGINNLRFVWLQRRRLFTFHQTWSLTMVTNRKFEKLVCRRHFPIPTLTWRSTKLRGFLVNSKFQRAGNTG